MVEIHCRNEAADGDNVVVYYWGAVEKEGGEEAETAVIGEEEAPAIPLVRISGKCCLELSTPQEWPCGDIPPAGEV